jgi:hypothetical protein
VQKECDKEAKAYMFAPAGHTPATELLVKLNASVPNSGTEANRRDWSSPFLLVPASGSTSLTIPQSSTSSAFLVAVTSVPVSTELFGRTKAVAFQPRYWKIPFHQLLVMAIRLFSVLIIIYSLRPLLPVSGIDVSRY